MSDLCCSIMEKTNKDFKVVIDVWPGVSGLAIRFVLSTEARRTHLTLFGGMCNKRLFQVSQPLPLVAG